MSRATHVDAFLYGLVDYNGEPLNGGKVYSYSAGTTSPKQLYSAYDKTYVHANPLILDSLGQAQAWADGNYKFIITTADDVPVFVLDYLTFGLPEEAIIWCGSSTGSNNAYSGSTGSNVTEYSSGQTFSFIANHTNTGASTFNVDGVGAVTIKRGSGADLIASDIQSGNTYSVIYDIAGGVGRFILADTNPNPTFTSLTVTGLIANQAVFANASKQLITYAAGDARNLLGVGESQTPTFAGATFSAGVDGTSFEGTTFTGTGFTGTTFTGSTLTAPSGTLEISSLAADGVIEFATPGGTCYWDNSGIFRPAVDNTQALGWGSHRWNVAHIAAIECTQIEAQAFIPTSRSAYGSYGITEFNRSANLSPLSSGSTLQDVIDRLNGLMNYLGTIEGDLTNAGIFSDS